MSFFRSAASHIDPLSQFGTSGSLGIEDGDISSLFVFGFVHEKLWPNVLSATNVALYGFSIGTTDRQINRSLEELIQKLSIDLLHS
jgi:hypothetical protein